jgi:(E)-4-hydroxy-3-methylbut-2-enyl-diphosphate synthase
MGTRIETRRERVEPRKRTRAVRVGRVTIGGGRPVVIQSMTTTTPDDLAGSVAQIAALAAAGCAVVRLAVPSARAAAALPELRRALRARRVRVPIVADVHFDPDLALAAAPHVEKVRINPGNFAANPAEARRHLEPLISALRAHGAALRIGVNHGSLAPHVVAALGNGPAAMVASAIEYLRLCRELEFADVIVSLKASNPALMVEANRALARGLAAEGFPAPIHLGVTEAGEGDEGALRSAVAMGTLLAEGTGDTIRVSLAGDPIGEIPVCRAILRGVRRAVGTGRSHGVSTRDACALPPRAAARAQLVQSIALRRTGSLPAADLLAATQDRESNVDAVAIRLPGSLSARSMEALIRELPHARNGLRRRRAPLALWVEIDASRAMTAALGALRGRIDRLAIRIPRAMLGHTISSRGRSGLVRSLRARCREAGLGEPALIWAGRPLGAAGCVLARTVASPTEETNRLLLLPCLPADPWEAAVALGGQLLDGIADGIVVPSGAVARGFAPLRLRSPARLAAEILQATRRRLYHAEFIACPGCGRLHYDLAGTVRRLKRRLARARGVRVAVMGCTVNGPGEMADADFGYVGAGRGRVDLYAGGRRIRRGLPPEEADRALLALLRERGLMR